MFNTKSKNFSSTNPPPPKKDLNLTIRFTIDSNEPYTTQSLVHIKSDHTLVSNTDTKIEEMQKEITELISQTYESFIKSVDSSPKFTDGYHAEQLKEEQSQQ